MKSDMKRATSQLALTRLLTPPRSHAHVALRRDCATSKKPQQREARMPRHRPAPIRRFFWIRGRKLALCVCVCVLFIRFFLRKRAVFMRPTPRQTNLAASGGGRTGPSRASRIDAPLNSFRRRFLFLSYCTRPRCCCFSFAACGLRDSHSRRICRWLCPSPPAAKPNPRPVAVAHRR